MTRITVDADLLNKLRNLKEELELYDPSGVLLGRLYPTVPAVGLKEPPISEEELQRREKSDRWFTTAEVLARLEKL